MNMADKIELDLVSNLSETNSISASVSTFDDTNSGINLFRRESEGSIQFSQVTVNPVVCACKSRCCSKTVWLVLLHILIMLTSMAAIALSVWMVIYYFEIVKEQQSDMQQLVERITALENTTSRENQTEIEIQMLLPNISDMVESNSMVIQTLNKTLVRLENQMSEISMQLNRDLRGNVTQLTIDINNNLGSIRTLSGFLTDLDGKIQQVQNELIIATNTTINPFEGCIVSNEMCQGTEMNNIYWRECSTPYTALNVTVSYYNIPYFLAQTPRLLIFHSC